MSRLAVYITAGFFLLIWPVTIALAAVWSCKSGCIEHHGTELIELGIGALIVAPIAALSFLSAGRLWAMAKTSSSSRTRTVGSILSIGLVIAFAALTALALFMWAYASAGLLAKTTGATKVLDSIALALLMSIYSAAVCGGSWMALIGARKLEEQAEREKAARLEMFR